MKIKGVFGEGLCLAEEHGLMIAYHDDFRTVAAYSFETGERVWMHKFWRYCNIFSIERIGKWVFVQVQDNTTDRFVWLMLDIHRWGWGREALAEQGHPDAEIGMILQTGEDEFHDASAMLADLTRCEAVLCRENKDGSTRARILKEIRAMMEGCEVAVGRGVQVQILALEMDERDETDDEDDEE